MATIGQIGARRLVALNELRETVPRLAQKYGASADFGSPHHAQFYPGQDPREGSYTLSTELSEYLRNLARIVEAQAAKIDALGAELKALTGKEPAARRKGRRSDG